MYNIEDVLISEEISVVEALEKLDKTAKKILFVVEGKCLRGTVTDGDIRRWILSNGSLEASVKCVANYSPKYLNVDSEITPIDFMEQYQINAVPILNEKSEVVDIVFENDCDKEIVVDVLKEVPVVIMAGGKGTRLYPYTKILPKPLIPVHDIPIIEHIMKGFNHYGCKDFYLIVNHKKNMIKAYFAENNLPFNISYADEEKPLGTGGGLSLLKGKIDSTFILSNCDILITEDIVAIYNLHKEQKHLITMVCSAQNFVIPYGIVDIDENGEIEKMQEKPTLSFLTNTGCYIVEPEVIEELEENVAIGFPDIIEKYRMQGKKVGVYPISENAWLDMGQMDELKRMEKKLKGDS